MAPGWSLDYDTAHVHGCDVEFSCERFGGSAHEPSACDVEILRIEPADDSWCAVDLLLLPSNVATIVHAAIEATGRFPDSVRDALMRSRDIIEACESEASR